ncbi:sigma-70 family RNA polymerase sigma factor [Pendulispora brunnea]|uniref:Sigma-70 family RNA polymerase sigma factor n=1 Tax=Pendulispora brunnea TaxID=2905690 RepID=A0ABZ2K6X8_9BACT
MAVSSLAGTCLAPDHRAQEAPTVAMPTDFDTLYSAHAKFVWRAVVRLGVEPMAVEDVVQEIFLVVHRGLHDFEWRSSARTWIYGIAVNVVRHHRRARARKSHNAQESAEQLCTFPADPAHAPDAILEKAQAALLLLRVLDNLSSDLREVFVLAELEEITLAEIGKILGISSNTVASRLRAARQKFDQALVRERARDTWRVR